MDKYSPISTIDILSRYITTVLEYIAAELLEIAGNVAKDMEKEMITPYHLLLAVNDDDELKSIFLSKNFPNKMNESSLISSNKDAINKMFDIMSPDPITDEIDIDNFCRMKAIIRHAIDCWHKRVYYKKIYGDYYGGEGFYCDDKFDYWNYHALIYSK